MQNRFQFLYFSIISFLVVNFLTRIFLLSFSFENIELFTIPHLILVGSFYDFVTSLYYFIPLTFYLFLIPIKIFNSKPHQLFLKLVFGMILFAMIFNGVSEYFFWEEFGKRFNFIAVDYLVYTNEVIKNIWESYPIPLIVSLILIATISIIYFMKNLLQIQDNMKIKARAKFVGIYLLFTILFFNILEKQNLSNVSDNIFNNELAKNGTYSLFSAFRNNELDYEEFYKTLDKKVMFENLAKLEKFDDTKPKLFTSKNQENRKNVMLIMVESLSASYMGIYGAKHNITPHLDALAKKSIFFDNLYATGTRTVRGMEAVTLSIPPTAGRSIIKRPKNDNMDSIGEVFQKFGYENKFIYAGHGYFDNMNEFFSKNGFSIIDRLDFKDDETTFANAWGVCDEDLLTRSLKEADKSFESGKHFFNFIMTTSNHRPFTYPDGKIDIPSHSGRFGAVKYTDFAIHQFLEQAKSRKWFKNTIFVIIADHNGASAGKNSLPIYRYKIPLFIYSPANLEPKTVSKLSSQIDTLPTIFDILGLEYKARFYGNSILKDDFVERAFIGNYQKLGYLKNDILYFLTPDKKAHKMKVENLGLKSVQYSEQNISDDEVKDISTYYQSASYFYRIQ